MKLIFLVCLSVISIVCSAEVPSLNCADDQYICRADSRSVVNRDLCCPCDINSAADGISALCLFSCAPQYNHGDCLQLRASLTCPAGSGAKLASECSNPVLPQICNSAFCCCYCDAGEYSAGGDSATCLECSNTTLSGVGYKECYRTCNYGTGTNGYGKYNIRSGLQYYRESADGTLQCSNCVFGNYNTGDSLKCELCPIPHQGTLGGDCLLCELGRLSYYAYGTYTDSYRPCEAFGYALPSDMIINLIFSVGILALLPVTYLACRRGIRTAVGMFTYMVLPCANTLLNVAYMLESYFMQPATIYAPITPPIVVFLFVLWVYRAKPCLILCPLPHTWFEEEYDSAPKLIPILLLILINLPVYVLWFTFGVWLYITKAIAIGDLSSLWLRVWTGTTRLQSPYIIDTQLLNFCLSTQILLEALPLLVMQLNDSTLLVQSPLLGDWSTLRWLAYVTGLLSGVGGLYRILYYKIHRNVDLLDIPLSSKLCCFDLFPGSLELNHSQSSESNSGENDNEPTGSRRETEVVESGESKNVGKSEVVSVGSHTSGHESDADSESDKGHCPPQFKRILLERVKETYQLLVGCLRGAFYAIRECCKWLNKQAQERNRDIPDGYRRACIRGSVELGNTVGRSGGGLRGRGDDNEDEYSESLMFSHTQEVRELRGELSRLRKEFSATLSGSTQSQQKKASAGLDTTDEHRNMKDTVDL